MNQWKPAGLQRILQALHKFETKCLQGLLEFLKTQVMQFTVFYPKLKSFDSQVLYCWKQSPVKGIVICLVFERLIFLNKPSPTRTKDHPLKLSQTYWRIFAQTYLHKWPHAQS